ncbi:MAG: DUF5906 domain-containing protein [Promethearchaeota archaeon]
MAKKKAKKETGFSPKIIGDMILHGIDGKKSNIITDLTSGIVYIYKNGYYDSAHSNAMIEAIIDRLLDCSVTNNKIKEIFGYIKRHTYKDIQELKQHNNYICLNNCLLNVDTLETRPHSPDVFVTHKIDVFYDKDIDMTEWYKYIESLQPDKAKRDTLQECCGNIFDLNNYTLKKLVWLNGPKNSGKTTFFNIFIDFVGEDNVSSLSVNQLSEEHTNITIYEKIINIRSEIPVTIKLKNAEIIKEYTGGDRIHFNPKFQQPFDARPTAKLFFADNPPSIAIAGGVLMLLISPAYEPFSV